MLPGALSSGCSVMVLSGMRISVEPVRPVLSVTPEFVQAWSHGGPGDGYGDHLSESPGGRYWNAPLAVPIDGYLNLVSCDTDFGDVCPFRGAEADAGYQDAAVGRAGPGLCGNLGAAAGNFHNGMGCVVLSVIRATQDDLQLLEALSHALRHGHSKVQVPLWPDPSRVQLHGDRADGDFGNRALGEADQADVDLLTTPRVLASLHDAQQLHQVVQPVDFGWCRRRLARRVEPSPSLALIRLQVRGASRHWP